MSYVYYTHFKYLCRNNNELSNLDKIVKYALLALNYG